MEKSKVMIYTDRGLLVPARQLEKFEIRKDSKQVRAEERMFLAQGLVPWPFNPEAFLNLLESNVYLFRCVYQTAQDVSGLGWIIKLKEGVEEDDAAQLERLREFLKRCNPRESLRSVVKACAIDLLSIGWMAIEVVRNAAGRVAELYHVPAHTLKVHKSWKLFCQTRLGKSVWFKAFGLEDEFHKDTGQPGLNLSPEQKANELIYHKEYYARSDYYGCPPALPAVGAILSLMGIRDYNLAFFENYGVPAGLVVLEGEWEEGSDKVLRDWLTAGFTGAKNQHKTAVLQVAPGCKASFVQLSTEIKEGSFKVFARMQRDEVLAAYSMPPYRIGIAEVGALGGNTARESTETYLTTVVEPVQETFEEIISWLLPEMGVDKYEVTFKDIDIRDLDGEVRRFSQLFSIGAVSPNEIRNTLDIGPAYDEGDSFFVGSMPVSGPLADQAAAAGAAGLPVAAEASKQADSLLQIQRRIAEVLDELRKENSSARRTEQPD